MKLHPGSTWSKVTHRLCDHGHHLAGKGVVSADNPDREPRRVFRCRWCGAYLRSDLR